MTPALWCLAGMGGGLVIAFIAYVVIISGLYDFLTGNWYG